jgi:cell wall-associated NlpC family hydrolase
MADEHVSRAVYACVLQSLAARYAWGGGHDQAPGVWPAGPWDCSGYTRAVLREIGRPLSVDMTATRQWKHYGSPRALDAQAGDLMWWGTIAADGTVKIAHCGFCILAGTPGSRGIAVSAFRGGPNTHGDNPKACVQPHTFSGTGLTLIGSCAP